MEPTPEEKVQQAQANLRKAKIHFLTTLASLLSGCGCLLLVLAALFWWMMRR